MEPCGITEFGEEGWCATHLAELERTTLNRVNGLRAAGRLEFQKASGQRHPNGYLRCGRKRRGPCLVPQGLVIEAEEEGMFD